MSNLEELIARINSEGFWMELHQHLGNAQDGTSATFWRTRIWKYLPDGIATGYEYGDGDTALAATQAVYVKMKLSDGTLKQYRPVINNFHKAQKIDVKSLLSELGI